MTRDHMGKSEFNTEARAALEDGIDCCPICAVPFKADDVCADDITEGTCHAACLWKALDADPGRFGIRLVGMTEQEIVR
jgi:hypothetical protein